MNVTKHKQTAVLACLAGFTVGCSAQSSVAIYGLMDAAISRVDNVNGKSTLGMDSGAWQSSRLGFRGTEDLGAGMRALFTLESGVNVETGASGTPFFGRQSFVGLSGAWGTVTLGRQYDFVYYLADGRVVAGGLESAVSGGPGGSAGEVSPLDLHSGGTRYNQSVKWVKSFGGLGLGLMHSLGRDRADAGSSKRATSATLTYKAGGFEGGLAWVRDTYDAAGSGNYANEVFAAKATHKTGPWFVFVNLATGDSRNSLAKHVPVEAGFMYAITPLWEAGAALSHARLTNAAGGRTHSNRILLGTTYTLSKRTLLYGVAGRSETGDASVYRGFVGAPGGASGPSNGTSQRVVRAGIRHTF